MPPPGTSLPSKLEQNTTADAFKGRDFGSKDMSKMIEVDLDALGCEILPELLDLGHGLYQAIGEAKDWRRKAPRPRR